MYWFLILVHFLEYFIIIIILIKKYWFLIFVHFVEYFINIIIIIIIIIICLFSFTYSFLSCTSVIHSPLTAAIKRMS